MDGNLLPRDGESFDNTYYPEPPIEQQEAEQAEKGKKAASYPVLPEIAEWFQNRIKACDTIDNIQITTTTVNGVGYDRNMHVEAQILAYQLLKQLLEQEYHKWQEFQDKT